MKEGGMEKVTGTTYWAKRKRRHGILQKRYVRGGQRQQHVKNLRVRSMNQIVGSQLRICM
jgi:hypothetical protein